MKFLNKFIFLFVGCVLMFSWFYISYPDKAFAFTGGDGSSGNPYQVASWADLNDVRNYLSSYFILTADLSSSSPGYAGIGDDWTPIGDSTTPFTGNFNGNYKTISNLIVNLPFTDSVGLFGYVSNEVISNVGLIGANISGQFWVGGLVGYQIGGSITNSYSTGSVSGYTLAGGLVGYNQGTISYSYATGNTSGDSTSGGLVGYNQGTISNSYATGNTSGIGEIGGLVGYNQGTISNSYATGTASVSNTIAGGLVGYNNNGTVSNSYATGIVSNHGIRGGLIGFVSAMSTVSNCGWWTGAGPDNAIGNPAGNITYNEADKTVFYSQTHDVYDSTVPYWNFGTSSDWTARSDNYPIFTWGTIPILAEIKSIDTPRNDTTPEYIFQSNKSGTITYGGACSSSTTQAVAGANHIVFNQLALGTYSDCTITVTDGQSNVSSPLSVSPFTIIESETVIGGGSGSGGGTVACASNSNCGTDEYTDLPFCQDNNVYQNFKTYTCNSPGTTGSSCSNTTTPTLKTTCAANQICDSGVCVDQKITCVLNSDCGKDEYTDLPFCQDNNVYQNFKTYTCNSTGTTGSSCASSVAPTLKTTCASSQVCKEENCVAKVIPIVVPVKIVDEQGKETREQPVEQPVEQTNEGQQTGGQESVGQQAGGQEFGGQTVEETGNNFVDNVVIGTAKAIETISTVIIGSIPEPVKATVEETRKIVNTPVGSVITKTASTTGLVIATVATTAPIVSIPFAEIFLFPVKFLGLLLTALGLKKRYVPWGAVYDSVTKRPLDPAYVTLTNVKTGAVSASITDIDGRYGFLVEPGIYQIKASKTNYTFPSKKLSGETQDELHPNLYFGEEIVITKQGEVIIKNIPLDPVKFDWNEFAKKDKSLMKFYSKWDRVLARIYDLSFIVGFFVAIVAFIFAPYPYNTIIVTLYFVLLLLRILGLKPKSYGYITDKSTGDPLSFAIVRVMMPDSNIEVSSKPADKYGKYYCLVPPGKYYVKIERKEIDGSYSPAFTSQIIDVSKKGIIKEKFKV